MIFLSLIFSARPLSLQIAYKKDKSDCSVCSALSNTGFSSVSQNNDIPAAEAISLAITCSFAFSQLRLRSVPLRVLLSGTETAFICTSDG